MAKPTESDSHEDMVLLIIGWPGGMRGAIESAALVVHKRWRVGPKAKVHIADLKSKIQILQISDPPQISPQRPRSFRRAAAKPLWG